MMKKIELNLGVGMNMFFPEPVVVEIEDGGDLIESYEKYLEFCKTLEEPDYEYLTEDINQNIVRPLTFGEYTELWGMNINFQQKFK